MRHVGHKLGLDFGQLHLFPDVDHHENEAQYHQQSHAHQHVIVALGALGSQIHQGFRLEPDSEPMTGEVPHVCIRHGLSQSAIISGGKQHLIRERIGNADVKNIVSHLLNHGAEVLLNKGLPLHHQLTKLLAIPIFR